MPVQTSHWNKIRATFDHYFANGDFDHIITEGERLLTQATAENNREKMKAGYLFLIKAHYYLGQFEKAYEYALYYQQLCEKYNDVEQDFHLHYMQAHIYEYEQNFEQVQQSIRKGVSIAITSQDYAQLCRMKIFSSHIALSMNQLEDALSEAQTSIALLQQYAPENLQLYFRCQLVLASALNRLYQQDAPSIALHTHPIAQHNPFERCRLFYTQALDSAYNQNLDLTLQQLNEAHLLALQNNDLLMQMRIVQKQAMTFEQLARYKEAFDTMKQLEQLKEAFHKSNISSNILAFSIKNNLKEMQMRANLDPLSGVYNRYYLEESANELLAQAMLHNDHICCIVFDVDNFKQINDTHGHLVGDKVIKMLGQTCQATLSDTETIIARYGGDEFVILAKSYGEQDVLNKSQRIFEAITSNKIYCDTVEFSVSLSMGIVCNRIVPTSDFKTLFHAADQALYRAKNQGKNQIVYVTDDSSEDVS